MNTRKHLGTTHTHTPAKRFTASVAVKVVMGLRWRVKVTPPTLENYSNGHAFFSSVQFSSVAQQCLILCNPVDCGTPGLPVHHQLLELAQTHIQGVSDAMQPSHPLSPPFPPAFNLSQHQGLFPWVGSLHQVARVLELQLQHQSFQWIFRMDFL